MGVGNEMTAKRRPRQNAITFEVRSGALSVLGRPIFTGDQKDLVREIEAQLTNERPALLVTLNVDQTLNLERNDAFRSTVAESELLVIDGTPISWLGALLGANTAHRNTGADLLPAVASVAAERGWRIAITGGSIASAGAAASALKHRYGAEIHAVEFPFIRDIDDPRAQEVIVRLWELRPAVVFVCLGSPKQELWFARWRSELPPAVYVGAGAAVDFAAGFARRAPQLLQRLGLEWAYRLVHEPRRLGHRYLVRGPGFLRIIARSVIRKCFRGDRDASTK